MLIPRIAIIDTVMSSPKEVIIIAIGPLHTLSAAITREPRILSHAKLITQQGHFALDKDVDRFPGYNIVCGIKEAHHVLRAGLCYLFGFKIASFC